MSQRVLETERDRELLFRFIEGRKLPITVSISDGGRRSTKQNRLNRLWMNEIAEQMDGWSPEYARAYCKLTIGVPILRAENEVFCERYDAVVKPMPYETKMDLMMEPLDFPVTRLMTVRQQTKYLDGVHQHFSEKGLILTDPGDRLARHLGTALAHGDTYVRLLKEHQSDASSSPDASDTPADSPLPGEEGDGANPDQPASSPSQIQECAVKILGIAVDPLFETPQQRRGALESAKNDWKALLPEADHNALRALVSSADAIIKDHADYDAAVSHFSDMLEISADEFPKKEGE